jgi:hypothetical protein
MKHESSEDEDEIAGNAEQVVDYDTLDAVDGEDHVVKTAFETEDGDEEVSSDIGNLMQL